MHGWAEHEHWIKIKSSKFSNMREISNCSDNATFYECLVKMFINSSNSTKCGRKCLPKSFMTIIGSAKNVSDKSKFKLELKVKFLWLFSLQFLSVKVLKNIVF